MLCLVLRDASSISAVKEGIERIDYMNIIECVCHPLLLLLDANPIKLIVLNTLVRILKIQQKKIKENTPACLLLDCDSVAYALC